jgi:hypothetical protein
VNLLARTHLLTLAAILGIGSSAAAQPGDEPGFSFSGSQRTRYETLEHQFRADLDSSDRALALQTSVHFDWRLPKLQVVGEVMDSRAAGNDARSYLSTSGINALEPIQAYVAWQHASTADPGSVSTLRAGRMTIDIGKRRLVARSRFRNTVDSFTGVDWEWRDSSGRAARAFYFRPTNILPGDDTALLDDGIELDRDMRRNELVGFYFQPAPFADGRTVEFYVFDHDLRPTASPLFEPDMAVDHVTMGSRFYRTAEPGRLSYEVEAVVQRGRSGGVVNDIERTDLAHRAHFLHFEIGYQLDLSWSPNVVFQYDRASGDKNPADDRNERFDTLFGDRSFEFGPTGLYGAIARANLRSPGVRLTVRPRPRWRCVVAYRRVALDEPRDEWAGSDYADPTGVSGRSIGRHVEASFTWTAIDDRLAVEAGVARLVAGSFVPRAAGTAFHGDPSYFYLGATTSF